MYVAVASAQTKSYDEALSMLETGLNYVEENDAGTKSFFYGQMGDVWYVSPAFVTGVLKLVSFIEFG